MTNTGMPSKYSKLEAWAHDTFIADRALRLHDYILDTCELNDVLNVQNGKSLLDVGCGGGQAAILIKQRYPNLSITGIDLSEWMISRAQQRARSRDCKVHFEVADAQALPFSDRMFDVVYSFGSAKHWPDSTKGLGECWRVLKPSGELLVADATSDATRREVENFYEIAGFPRLLKKPIAWLLLQRMFKPAKSVEGYRQIAAELHLPKGTVSHLPSMPAFVFRTRKPAH